MYREAAGASGLHACDFRRLESVIRVLTGNNALVTSSAPPDAIDGRYVLESVIGRGGMAEVRRATDVRLGRSVAVKLLHESLAAQPEARLRFDEEARAARHCATSWTVAHFEKAARAK